ncbi:FAD-dependent oxidoreductase [Thioclava sp. BHET1]|nr:FAD-dependent oxidoreductase [Thioclava sp. BHET1]
MRLTKARHVAVIGGGVIGAATCEALLRAGCRVTLIEPDQPGGPHCASYGNGAFISPASVVPMSMPGLWKKVPGYILDRNGPFTLRWPYLPRLAGWVLRFLAAGWTKDRVDQTAHRLADLLADAPRLHSDLALRIGAPELLRDGGLFYLYADRGAYEADRLSWDLRRRNGVRMSWLLYTSDAADD